MFVPLAHAPGHAQVDFGETLGVIGGVQRKLHYFAMALPHSDAFFVKAYGEHSCLSPLTGFDDLTARNGWNPGCVAI